MKKNDKNEKQLTLSLKGIGHQGGKLYGERNKGVLFRYFCFFVKKKFFLFNLPIVFLWRPLFGLVIRRKRKKGREREDSSRILLRINLLVWTITHSFPLKEKIEVEASKKLRLLHSKILLYPLIDQLMQLFLYEWCWEFRFDELKGSYVLGNSWNRFTKAGHFSGIKWSA